MKGDANFEASEAEWGEAVGLRRYVTLAVPAHASVEEKYASEGGGSIL